MAKRSNQADESLVCLTLVGETPAADIGIVEELYDHIACVELRADFLSSPRATGESLSTVLADFPRMLEELESRLGEKRLKTILTLRRTSDGGRFAGPDAERIDILRGVFARLPKAGLSIESGGAGFTFLDLELGLEDEPGIDARAVSSLIAEARGAGTQVIRSYHDFEGLPADLAGLLSRLYAGGDLAKLAVTPRSTRDLLRLHRACRNLEQSRTIIVGMGDYGFPTRVLPEEFRSFLSFASPPGREVAPGHIDAVRLSAGYGLGSRAKPESLFAVIGNPIMHSRSPEYHNDRFKDDAIAARYVPIQVDEVYAFFELADAIRLRGVSVTIPHKSAVLEVVDAADEASEACGAANTLIRNAEGGWDAMNADVPGFLRPLAEHFPQGLSGLGVTVLGAGGAARAVAYALHREGCRVLICNRTVERAEALARNIETRAGEIETAGLDGSANDIIREHRSIIVNTTSLGMHPLQDGEPIPDYAFSGDELVYDAVYTPPETLFLARARRAGCPVVSGEEMFRAQAEVQYEAFRQSALGAGAP